MKNKYGLSLDDYDALLRAQAGVCAICGRPESRQIWLNGEVPNLHVDHDHGTGTVRGLLCSNCNTGLGKFHDDPALFRAAIGYLGEENK